MRFIAAVPYYAQEEQTMNPILESLSARKSVRVFEEKRVPEEMKHALLDAAAQAPTAGNQQLYTILDVTDDALRVSLSELCDHQPFIATAPVVLVFLADCARWPRMYRLAGCTPRAPGVGDLMLAVTDASIAAQNVVVAAQSMGLGSCYIGDVMENCEKMREALKLPPYVFPCAMLVIGYPTEGQKTRAKPTRFEQAMFVHENVYTPVSDEALRDMVTAREEARRSKDAPAFDYDTWMRAFCARKYQSDFSREMSRSVAEYLKDYSN